MINITKEEKIHILKSKLITLQTHGGNSGTYEAVDPDKLATILFEIMEERRLPNHDTK